MRRNDKKIEDESIIIEILTKSLVCRVGLFDDEYPYVVPMNFGYNGNSLYFHSATKGKKLDLIRRNNKVSFEIEQSYEIVKDGIIQIIETIRPLDNDMKSILRDAFDGKIDPELKQISENVNENIVACKEKAVF